MGKQKRARQKYHIACAKGKLSTDEQVDKSSYKKDNNLSWNVQPSENIFAGLDIDMACLRKSLADDDDGKSVKSISKSIKNSSCRLLKKEDKRKLRHNLFIEKIDSIYAKLNKSKKKSKNKSNSNEVKEEDSKIEYLLNKNPVKVKKMPVASTKQRGIKKAKQRKEMMLKDISLFKTILTDPKFIEKPLDHVKTLVEDKVVSEII